jgi:hypothetical protein
MSKRRKNAGEGYGYMFHGSFLHKADAEKKERTRKGSFIKHVYGNQGWRWLVMTPRTNPIKRKKRNPVVKPNPSELLVLGANPVNPSEITVPAGSTITIRMNPTGELAQSNPAGNGIFSSIGDFIHGKTYAGKLALAGHRSAKRDRKAGKWGRMSREKRRDLVTAAGVSPKIAEAWAKLRFEEIPEGWQSAIMARLNPVCGASIGGYPCTRKPGHRGPHLPQGATMRPRTRLRSGWKPRGSNPSAAAIRERFTGTPSEFFFVENEPHMTAGDYAQLGELLALYVKPKLGGQVQTIKFVHNRPILVSDESARQLYFVGEDQDITPSLHLFAEREQSGLIELGETRRIDYKQRKEHVPDPDIDEWRHEFGEESGVLPTLLFDRHTKRLLLKGGEYAVRPEGIVN